MDRQEAKRYGQTVNNNFIEMAVLRTLEEFGFSRELVVEALQQTDNNQGQSLELLMQVLTIGWCFSQVQDSFFFFGNSHPGFTLCQTA